jgi:hypothetical protein
MVRLAQKLQKAKRNKRWRKRKRKHVAELFQKVPLIAVFLRFYAFGMKAFLQSRPKIRLYDDIPMSMFHRRLQIMTELTRKLMSGGLSK